MSAAAPEAPAPAAIDAFIARWQQAGGSERANYQLFVGELAALLGLPQPEPAREDGRDNAYVFERRVEFRHGDGSVSAGFIDCYRRGAFVLEAKKIRAGAGKGFDDALLRARSQAEQYARALPAAEGRPPFLVVVDVGSVIELYAEFSRSGATYTPFPDPRSHRIRLEDLRRPEVCARLRAVWLDPIALDPARRAARVTRALAEKLAAVARALEAEHPPQLVADFLSRCLFSMFAEDVGLLPRRSFGDLLERHRDRPEVLARMMEELWGAMDAGGFSAALAETLLRFNGKFFKDRRALVLGREAIALLIAAARSDWREVEPAIFGTLLERALDPAERHALGAHYTPRAYVERLVLPAVIEPLRADWATAHAAALVLAQEGKLEAAAQAVRGFLHTLTHVRVLDPACGSGNFLYVTLEHLKRLEGEVLNALDELGDTRGRLDLEGASVDPHQLLGLEINPRAAAIAEMVLWIGYLQWHFRVRGQVQPPLPVLRDFHNIEHRDAVLAYDAVEFATDEHGRPLTRWDGVSTRPHPVTGEPVPDEAAQVAIERYVNPRKAVWPEADFVVGNPPFIGAATMRSALGDGYVEALRGAWPTVPESADFVMYWWDHAAQLTRAGKLRRFGLITTNSLRQTFNRRVVARHLEAQPPLTLRFAIPDHPWVDSAQGAAVRVAMSVGDVQAAPGVLLTSVEEGGNAGSDDAIAVRFEQRRGDLHSDLRVGANVASAVALRANQGISSPGVKLHGAGFIVTPEQAASLGLGSVPGLEQHIRHYLNGRDLTDKSRGVLVIDFFGLSDVEVRQRFPAAYQWLAERVKPERDANTRAIYREYWWLFGEPRSELRKMLSELPRYIATVETAKHRLFAWLDASVLPDNKLVNIALDDALALGVLSSRAHIVWALASGSRLGVGNDPVYVKSRCFETFPFPDPSPEQAEAIRSLAEAIDSHRKRQQAAHPDLTLTGLYNVVEKLRAGTPLSAKERAIHDQGLAGVLKELHDELDAAVLAAYGWADLAPALVGAPGATTPLPDKPAPQAAAEEELLSRLVALNAQRAAEEARGTVSWLRPDFQSPPARTAVSGELDVEVEAEAEGAAPVPAVPRVQPWPTELPAQVRAVAELIATARAPLSEDAIAAHFKSRGPWRGRLPLVLSTLAAVGRVRSTEQGEWLGA